MIAVSAIEPAAADAIRRAQEAAAAAEAARKAADAIRAAQNGGQS
ncbi:hypothetical protein [Streptomyces sp. NPDC055036]